MYATPDPGYLKAEDSLVRLLEPDNKKGWSGLIYNAVLGKIWQRSFSYQPPSRLYIFHSKSYITIQQF